MIMKWRWLFFISELRLAIKRYRRLRRKRIVHQIPRAHSYQQAEHD